MPFVQRVLFWFAFCMFFLCSVFYVKCCFMLCFVCFVEFGKLFLACLLRSAFLVGRCAFWCILVLLLRLFSLYTTILDFVSGSLELQLPICTLFRSPILPFTRYLRHFGAPTPVYYRLHTINQHVGYTLVPLSSYSLSI